MGLSGITNVYAVDCANKSPNNELKQAIKWYRDSAEQKALYNQAFGMGSKYINNWVIKNKPKAKTWGVILDIDETTLDNSWYFEKCTDLAGDEDDFSHYVAIPEKSVALPGVVALTCSVKKQGGYVSLVSNRDGSFKDSSGNVMDATINNLKHEGVCFDQVVLANRKDSDKPSDKNPRFQSIISGNYDTKQMVWSNKLPAHQVIAYFGDNIQDFPVFKQAKTYAMSADDKAFNIFGNGYFIMPNPLYGSWEANEYK
jgi:5'-nucleotidase (lipoprotein e(P4) family)